MKPALFDPARHEPVRPTAWNETLARDTVAALVADAESRFTAQGYWPIHEGDGRDEDGQPFKTPLYYGACGVFWALHYLQSVGAVRLERSYLDDLDTLLARNRTWLGDQAVTEAASFLMGETSIRMMSWLDDASGGRSADALRALIEGNLAHPSREMLWGSPSTMLAALFMHERTGDPVWADLFRLTADRLHEQLEWSDEHGCRFWSQDMYGKHFTFLGAGHGFVGNLQPLIRGRHLLEPARWQQWHDTIVDTIGKTAICVDGRANWNHELIPWDGKVRPMLMQFCHGAPGFVICLADLPGNSLDDLLVAAGEAVWAAGPLTKGPGLCHGTAGNGYALLALYRRTGDAMWLERARRFAMHAIEQSDRAAQLQGHRRYSLCTGDLGLAVYLHHCLTGQGGYPTVDVFFPD
ncbi:hypothetical protein BH10PSE17_BH10PSE17_02270 [soil metagenome]